MQHNQRCYNKSVIPLKSILIGNGYVSPLDTAYGYYEMLCTTKPGVAQPVFNHSRCQVIADALPRCQNVYEACYRYPEVCKTTDEACGVIGQLFHNESHAGGRDPFDSKIRNMRDVLRTYALADPKLLQSHAPARSNTSATLLHWILHDT